MNVPSFMYSKWQALRSHGDATKIVELANQRNIRCSDETINRALRTGKCNDDLFVIISDFYETKANRVKEYL
jgi:hypothetical protein